jgi:hypothetical protein
MFVTDTHTDTKIIIEMGALPPVDPEKEDF